MRHGVKAANIASFVGKQGGGLGLLAQLAQKSMYTFRIFLSRI
jgi:hypothetical protein